MKRLGAPAGAHQLAASNSSNSGWVGGEPVYPRFSEVAARPVPKWCCQIRLASTRARRAAGRVPG